jgi:signal transduction histidine kinase
VFLPWLLQILLLSSLYYVTGRIGLLAALPPGVATVVWPASGLAIGTLLWFDNSLWPGILLGSFVLNCHVLLGSSGAAGASLFLSLGIAVSIAIGSTLQAVVAASLVKRFTGGSYPFNRVKDVSIFVLVCLFACLIASSIGSVTLLLGNLIEPGYFLNTWSTWWIGDVVGIFVMTPLFLFRQEGSFAEGKRTITELVFFVAFFLASAQFIFGAPFPIQLPLYRMAYFFFSLILWAAFRLGSEGLAVALFFTSVVAIWGTIQGTSQFVSTTLHASLREVQMYIGTITVTGLMLGAVLCERKKAVRELRDSATALKRSNEELEQFAHACSHDLKEPLRTVSSHLSLLEKSLGDKLEAEPREFLNFARGAARRMSLLIDDLLAYSRLDFQATGFHRVECDTILAETLSNLKAKIDEKAAVVTVEKLPSVLGDPVRLGQLFQNLIENALKYCRGIPRIEVRAEKKSDHWLFSVRDNGIGIEEKYQKRVFQLFRRLHSIEEYPGTGLGLATCRKIVQRHGGEIWVESEKDRGSTFYFTLPLVRNA